MEGSVFSARSIRGALRALADARRLGEHPLAGCKFVEARARLRLRLPPRQTPHTVALGHALRAALSQAIQSLKPAGAFDPNDAAWRYYTILHEQYERRRMPDAVMGMLVVEKSQYFSLQTRALAELGHVLAGWEQEQTQAQANATEPQSGPAPIFMAPAMVGKIFLGREALLRQMAAHLLQGEPVAVHGLPGVGKSTFVAALAHRPEMRQCFPDGVLWAGLGQGSDPFAWLGEWAAALGLPRAELAYLTTIEARANALHTAISTRRMLLVIDDAWTSDAALALRAGGPNCAHLLTTRLASVAADFAGANAFGLPELDEADGLAVLIQHAPALAQTPQVAAGLARAVGNLPLALTLMGRYAHKAAHGSQRRLQAALDALHQAETRLTLAQPTGPLDPDGNGASERSLQAAIGLSDAALDEPARQAFYALSVFPPKPNTFSEEAALAVTDEPPEALDALVDAGLLEVADGRYMLHPVLRDYGRLKLSDGEVYARMAAFFVELAGTHEWNYAVLDMEQSNLFAALDLARQCDLTLLRIRGVNATFAYLEACGQYGIAESYLREAQAVAEELDDKTHLTTVLLNLGRIAIKRADFADAKTLFERGLSLARESNVPALVAVLFQNLGGVLADTNDFEGARECYEEGLRLARGVGDKLRISALLMHLSSLLEPRGAYAQAETCTCEGLALAQEANQRDLIAAHLMQLGVIQSKRGEFVEGATNLFAALTLAREIGQQEIICTLLYAMGVGAVQFGQLEQAQAYLSEGSRIAHILGYRRLITLMTAAESRLAAELGELEKARLLAEQSLSAARYANHAWDLCAVLNSYGRVCQMTRNFDLAIERLNEAGELARIHMFHELQGYAVFAVGQIRFGQGRIEEAIRFANASLSAYREIQYWQTSEVEQWILTHTKASASESKNMPSQ